LHSTAPVTAIRGNVDAGPWAKDLSETEFVVPGGRKLYVLHNVKEIDLDLAPPGIDVVVAGRSHRPKVEEKNGILFVNPGSGGPRRFRLPITVAALEICGAAISPQILEIAP
jgi:putative phosphoesterase